MSYRDDYAAALARANTAERDLRDLQRQADADQAQQRALKEELQKAKNALREAERRVGSPQPNSGAANILLIAIFTIFAIVLWGWLSASDSSSYPYEPIPGLRLPTIPYLPASLPDYTKLLEIQEQLAAIAPIKKSCLLPAALMGEREPVSFERFVPPEGCLPALLADSEAEQKSAPHAPILIKNEAAFKKSYRCVDTQGNTVHPTSGTDLDARRLVLLYRSAPGDLEPYVERALTDGKEISLGLSGRIVPGHDDPDVAKEPRLYALQLLLPRGKQKITPTQCLPYFPSE